MSSMNLAVLLVLGLLLVMAQQSMQTSLRNPISEIGTSNCKIEILRLGLVFGSDTNERTLQDSGLYQPDSENPHVDIAGRRFHIGSLDRTPVIYVNAGSESVNVAAAIQTLLLRFRMRGIVFFGNAGSLDGKKLELGDVAVPEAVAFTGIWNWKNFQPELIRAGQGKLVFGDFNYPDNGENLLGTVEFEEVKLFIQGQKPKNVFWLQTSPSLYNTATQVLKDLELRRCYEDFCLDNKPKAVLGVRGSTSEIYVRNKAYGNFLRDTFRVSSADTSSASVALTCLSNEMPFMVFRGVSNIVGEKSSNSDQLSYLASYNALLAANKLMKSIPTPRLACV